MERRARPRDLAEAEARAYERLTGTDEALFYATMTRLMTLRLARKEP